MSAALLGGAIGLGKTLGLGGKLGGIGKKIGGLFGGGPDPNYSNEGLVDTIANFEEISTSEARRIAPKLIKAKAAGASNYELTDLTSSSTPSGYTDGMASSEKWQLVMQNLRPAARQYKQQLQAQQQQQEQQQQKQRSQAGAGSSGSGASGGATTGGASQASIAEYAKWIVAGLVAMMLGYLVTQQKA